MNETSQLTLFAEDFPAKIFPSQEKARALRASVAAYGLNTPDSLASYDPDTQSWRTSQHCLIEGLTVFSETFPRSGMMRNGTAYRLQPLAHLTDATASGLWATPTAVMGGCRRKGIWKGTYWVKQDGAKSQTRLSDQVVMIPQTWPTPCARDWKDSFTSLEKLEAQFQKRDSPSLALTIGSIEKTASGKLNPQWVEWLMGFPVGWTDLNNSETP